MLISTAFCPPMEFFALLAENSVVYLDAAEHYQKQSWRNRCRILTANGPMDINVPVVHGPESLFRTRMDQVKVDYSTDWVGRFEYAVESAYCSSPFFIYYRDGFFSLLDSRPELLWDLNRSIIDYFCARIGIAPEIRSTEEYIDASACTGDLVPDCRALLHPKHPNAVLSERGLDRPYWQVFRERFGFVPGLSVMDLLFNEGPESICLIKK